MKSQSKIWRICYRKFFFFVQDLTSTIWILLSHYTLLKAILSITFFNISWWCLPNALMYFTIAITYVLYFLMVRVGRHKNLKNITYFLSQTKLHLLFINYRTNYLLAIEIGHPILVLFRCYNNHLICIK